MSSFDSLIISDSNGLYLKTKSTKLSSNISYETTQIDANGHFSHLVSNNDGRLLIQLVKSKTIKIYDIVNNIYVFEELLPGLLMGNFSPKSTHLYTWQTNNQANNSNNGIKNLNNFPNLKIFKVEFNQTIKISLVGQFPLSYRYNRLFWSNDEKISMFIETETLNFFENLDFTKISKKINLTGLCDASLSPENHLIVIHTFDKKRNINLTRMFKYPNLEANSCICSIVLPIEAKNIEFKWNPIGTAVIIIAEIESTGKSYYDERLLFFMSMNGDSNNLSLKPDTFTGSSYAIHDISWTPDGKKFAVIHGSLPAQIFLFDLKCKIIFKFPKATRNILYFNQFGNILCTTAHGNAHGDVEMWNMENFKLISKFPIKYKTKCCWLPDGKHMMFAVTSPTLRVNNGYQIWNFMAEKVDSFTYESPIEMFDIFPIGNTYQFQKPTIPKIDKPIDLTYGHSPKVYVPKTTKKYLDDNMNNLANRKKHLKSSYYGKNVNKLDLQNNPFFGNKTNSSLSTANISKTSINASRTIDTTNTNCVDNLDTNMANEYKIKIKSLNKKVNEINKLKTKILENGYVPNTEQLIKLESEPFLIEEKSRLERLLGEIN